PKSEEKKTDDKADKSTDDKKDEPKKDEPKKDDPPKQDALAIEQAKPADQKPAEGQPGDSENPGEKKPKAVTIDVDGFESRAVVLPPGGGRFDTLIAVPGKLIFQKRPRSGSTGGSSPVAYYDLEKREEKTILDEANGYDLSADGKKLLVGKGGQWVIVNPAENQKFEKP